MAAKFSLCVLALCCSPVFAQMDSSALRSKYGEPLARETFKVSPNIEAVVNYGTGRQVCNIEISQSQRATPQEVDDVVNELAPPSVRGKEVNRGMANAARVAMLFVYYEHVTISELQDPNHPGRRTAVRITFTRPDCK